MSKEKDLERILEKARIEAQKDALMDFVVKNGKAITRISLVILTIIIISVATSIIKNKRQATYSKILQEAYIAQDVNDLKKSKELLKKILDSKRAPNSISTLASFRYADFLLQDSKNQEAFDIFTKIAECNSCEEFSRDLAKLLAIKTWIMDGEIQKQENVAQKMQSYALKAKHLKDHINEQMAIYQLMQGNLKRALDIYKKITNSAEASDAIKVRAQTHISDLISKIDLKDGDKK